MNTPKFKKGDWIKRKKDGHLAQVVMLLKTCYDLRLADGEGWWLDYDYQDNWELTAAPPKNKLEEAAEDYTDSSEWLIGENLEHIEAAFIAGAKWQKQHDAELIEIAYNDGITIGTTKQKEQMMEEAVEGIAHPDDCEIWVNLVGYGYDIKDGDKVRIIIVKE